MSTKQSGTGGGGATTLYLKSVSIDSRVLVSAGGGGAMFLEPSHTGYAGYAGGLVGGNGKGNIYTSIGASQDSGYKKGIGQDGRNATQYTTNDAEGGSGSGGGYWGGFASTATDSFSNTPGSGGSSYISGNPKCALHPQLSFYNTTILPGNETFKLPDGTLHKGNPTDGHFRITALFVLESFDKLYVIDRCILMVPFIFITRKN